MRELSLSILDLGENAVRAAATTIKIHVCEDFDRALLTISLEDDGEGMAPSVLAGALLPGFSTRQTTVGGMGLPLFSQTAHRAGGQVFLLSAQGKGVLVQGLFPLHASARPPLGDIGGTLALLAERGLTVHYRHTCRRQVVFLCLTGLSEKLPQALEHTKGLAPMLAKLGSVA